MVDSYTVKNIGRQNTAISITADILSCSKKVNNSYVATDCSEFFRSDFKYKVMLDPTGGSRDCTANNSNCTAVTGGEGNFSNMHVGKNTLVGNISLPNNSKYKYYVFLYLDGNVSNPNIDSISGNFIRRRTFLRKLAIMTSRI